MDYQGNTDKSKSTKPPEKHIEKVVTGEVIQRPKSIGHKFKNIFFGGDVKTSARYVAGDVLLPALRNLVWDMISEGSKRVIFGESGFRRRPTEYRSRVQYNSPIYRPTDPRLSPARLPDQPMHPARVQRRDMNDVIFASREEAERAIEQLIDIIDKYEVASWADFCEMINVPSAPIDNKWGWTYLTNVTVRQVRDGYVIDLPALEAV